MDADGILVDIFAGVALILVFVAAVSIFLNVLGYTMIGGEVKKEADISMCKVAVANCATSRLTNSDCGDICLPCSGSWYGKCLKGDLSLFK